MAFSYFYTNSQVNVGGTTTFNIGNDLNGKGVVFNTDKVQGVIGGNVTLESPQDTYEYDSNQKSAGFNLDVDLMGNGKGSSLSVNGAKTNINANSKIVGQQTGIFANEADLIVEGKGNFKGAVFTTSEEAQANGKSNIVFKQGVTSTDIVNTTSYDGDAISAGLSIGKIKDKPQATMNGIGYGTDGDSDSSITKGGVSDYNDPQGILTTDNRQALAGKLESVFDEQRITEELQAQNQITKEFGKEAPKAVGDFAVNRQLALIGQGKVDEADKWAEGGAYRVALHTLVGAIATGSVEGALASGTTAVSIPAVSDYLDKQGVDETTKNALLLGLSTAAGAIVGGDTASTASSVNQTQNNYLNHIQLQNWVDGLKACNGNSTCVTRVNDIYQKFDKQQQNRFNSVCEDNFNIAQCKDEIANYNNAYPSSNIAEPLYKQIGELGGGPSTYINVRNNNGYSIQNRDRAIAKIARAEGKPVDALINELWYASLYGSGRSGPVVSAKAPINKPNPNNSRLNGTLDGLEAQEKKFVQEQLKQGSYVTIISTGKGRTPDFIIDGARYELKTVSNIKLPINGTSEAISDKLSKAMSSTIMKARGQSSSIIVDARNQAGMNKDIATRSISRAYGADKATNKGVNKIKEIKILLPNGTSITRKP